MTLVFAMADEEGVITYICAFLCWPFGLIKWVSIKDNKPKAAQNVLIITIIAFVLSMGGGWQYRTNLPF
jgi:hypothetical protein